MTRINKKVSSFLWNEIHRTESEKRFKLAIKLHKAVPKLIRDVLLTLETLSMEKDVPIHLRPNDSYHTTHVTYLAMQDFPSTHMS